MWKLDRLKARAEANGHYALYSENNGIGTLTIQDKNENIVKYWEMDIEEDEDIDDLLT